MEDIKINEYLDTISYECNKKIIKIKYIKILTYYIIKNGTRRRN